MQGHAVDTYEEFVMANRDKLKKLPPPLVALKYYKAGDLYFFDALQTKGGKVRRPECRSGREVFGKLHDVHCTEKPDRLFSLA